MVKKSMLIIGMLAALYTGFAGIREFDNATHWIPLFRGLFWSAMGVIGFWVMHNEFKGQP